MLAIVLNMIVSQNFMLMSVPVQDFITIQV